MRNIGNYGFVVIVFVVTVLIGYYANKLSMNLLLREINTYFNGATPAGVRVASKKILRAPAHKGNDTGAALVNNILIYPSTLPLGGGRSFDERHTKKNVCVY